MIIWYWSVKGGVGTSVTAAATAIRLAAEKQDTTLVDLMGDQPSLLGVCESDGFASKRGIGDWACAGENVAADAIGRLVQDVAPNLRLLRRGTVPLPTNRPQRLMLGLDVLSRGSIVVVDAGLDMEIMRACLKGEHISICVLRACYLAIVKAQEIAGPYDVVTVVEEPGRALKPRDVAVALGSSCLERIPWDPRVARSVDAGTIIATLPAPLRRFGLPV